MTRTSEHIHRSDPGTLRTLHRRLRAMSSRVDLLHELVGAGHFDEMAMTRDGLLVARPRGADGFDAFIGRPTVEMRRRTARLWRELDEAERALVLDRLREQSIPLEAVGIPSADVERPVPSRSR